MPEVGAARARESAVVLIMPRSLFRHAWQRSRPLRLATGNLPAEMAGSVRCEHHKRPNVPSRIHKSEQSVKRCRSTKMRPRSFPRRTGDSSPSSCILLRFCAYGMKATSVRKACCGSPGRQSNFSESQISLEQIKSDRPETKRFGFSLVREAGITGPPRNSE